MEHSPGLSGGRSVCQSVGRSTKCIVAKWLIGSGCRLGGEWGWLKDGCIGGAYRRRGRGSFGVKLGIQM